MPEPLKIEGNDKFIKQILSEKYKIDVYQREYKWGEDHVFIKRVGRHLEIGGVAFRCIK